jgi:hypothetical protein
MLLANWFYIQCDEIEEFAQLIMCCTNVVFVLLGAPPVCILNSLHVVCTIFSAICNTQYTQFLVLYATRGCFLLLLAPILAGPAPEFVLHCLSLRFAFDRDEH